MKLFISSLLWLLPTVLTGMVVLGAFNMIGEHKFNAADCFTALFVIACVWLLYLAGYFSK